MVRSARMNQKYHSFQRPTEKKTNATWETEYKQHYTESQANGTKKNEDGKNGQCFHKLWQTGVYFKFYQVRNKK